MIAILDEPFLVNRWLRRRVRHQHIRRSKCCGRKRLLIQWWISLAHHWLYVCAICGVISISKLQPIVHRQNVTKILHTCPSCIVVWMGCTECAITSWAALTIVGIYQAIHFKRWHVEADQGIRTMGAWRVKDWLLIMRLLSHCHGVCEICFVLSILVRWLYDRRDVGNFLSLITINGRVKWAKRREMRVEVGVVHLARLWLEVGIPINVWNLVGEAITLDG